MHNVFHFELSLLPRLQTTWPAALARRVGPRDVSFFPAAQRKQSSWTWFTDVDSRFYIHLGKETKQDLLQISKLNLLYKNTRVGSSFISI